MRTYPVSHPTSVPGTGSELFSHLMRNISAVAPLGHTVWYEGEAAKLKLPGEYAFRGDIPKDKTLELIALTGTSLADGRPAPYTFTGQESFVLVSDLSEGSLKALDIPEGSSPKAKVYNSNFKPFGKLDEFTKASNLLSSLSVPKSISSYFRIAGNMTYSERDALRFIRGCFDDLNGKEMRHAIYGNHQVWMALSVMRDKVLDGEVIAEFHAQDKSEYFLKDVVTILPGLLYAAANLGEDPVVIAEDLQRDVETPALVGVAREIQRIVRA